MYIYVIRDTFLIVITKHEGCIALAIINMILRSYVFGDQIQVSKESLN